jgi:hypothetical protein
VVGFTTGSRGKVPGKEKPVIREEIIITIIIIIGDNAPTILSATAVVPKTLYRSLQLLNLKEGISNNIKRSAVLGSCYTVDTFFSLQE